MWWGLVVSGLSNKEPREAWMPLTLMYLRQNGLFGRKNYRNYWVLSKDSIDLGSTHFGWILVEQPVRKARPVTHTKFGPTWWAFDCCGGLFRSWNFRNLLFDVWLWSWADLWARWRTSRQIWGTEDRWKVVSRSIITWNDWNTVFSHICFYIIFINVIIINFYERKNLKRLRTGRLVVIWSSSGSRGSGGLHLCM